MKLITSSLFLFFALGLSAQRMVPQIVVDHIPSKRKTNTSFLAAGANIVYQENFEGSATSFPYNGISVSTASSDGGFSIGTTSESNKGQVWKVPSHTRFAYSNDDHCNCDKSNDMLVFPVKSLSGLSNMYFLFDVYFNRFTGSETAVVEYDTGNGFQTLSVIKPNVLWQSYKLYLKGADNKTANVRIKYGDGGSWGSGLAIDNVVICEAAHENDLAVDSIFINGYGVESFYQEVPLRQSSNLKMTFASKISNQGKQTQTNVKGHTSVSGMDEYSDESFAISLSSGSIVSVNSIPSYLATSGIGTYRFNTFALSDSADANALNDTLKYQLEITDSTFSRVRSSKAIRGFSFGPGVPYVLTYLLELTAPDTINSMSVFLHENTEVDASFDLQLYSEFFPNVSGDLVKDTFPQINEAIKVKKEHLGKWVTFRIPQTPLKPGKYFVGIAARSKHVVVGVGDNPVTKGLVKSRISSGGGNADYIPFVKVNTLAQKCDSMTVNPVVTRPACGFQNGQIYAKVSGGNWPLKFQWNKTANYRTDSVISGLGSGVYDVVASDTLGCTANFSIALNNSGSIIANIVSLQHEKCFGDQQGSISVSGSGGVSPYSYKWNTGSTDSSISSLKAGRYTIEINDASGSGCKTYQSVLVLGPKEPLTVRLESLTNSCYNDSIGVVESFPRGGFGGYQYSWTGTTQTSRKIDSLKNGLYRLQLTDGNGCMAVDSTTITGSPEIVVSGFVIDTAGRGSIVLNLAGGVPPFKYSWKGPAGSDFNDPGTMSLTNLRYQGKYVVSIKDSANCEEVKEYQVGGVVNISEENQLSTVRVFPNPVIGNVVTLVSNKDLIQSVRVLTLAGSQIVYLGTNQRKVEVNLNQAGFYIVAIELEGGEVIYSKVVKRD